MNIFAEQELRGFLQTRLDRMKGQVESEGDNYLLNVSEVEYVAHLVETFRVELIEFHFDRAYVTTREAMIPAENHPSDFLARRGDAYKRDLIKYHLPFTGLTDLLRCSPSTRVVWTETVGLEVDEITFEIVNFYDDPERLNQEASRKFEFFKKQLQNVSRDVEAFNASLERDVQAAFQARKKRVLKKHSVVAALKVPLRKRTDLPETFSVPSPEARKKIRPRPQVSERGFQPEPTIEEGEYLQILEVLYDVGTMFERLPSTYSGKVEEDLRDHFLLYLEPRFEGSATGETFNRRGKTDILLRYENTNVFIAECKFWRGKVQLLQDVSQLLSYLTWRDSKTALVIFVRNQGFSEVIEKVRQHLPVHTNFVRSKADHREGWQRYVFHLDGDLNREVSVAVLLFHLAEVRAEQ